MASSLEVIGKLAGESNLFDMDFAGAVSSGELIASITSSTFTNLGRVDSSTDITLGTSTYLVNVVQIRISDGQLYETYEIIITVLTNLGNTIVGKGILQLEKE
jgi:hypothetical protein